MHKNALWLVAIIALFTATGCSERAQLGHLTGSLDACADGNLLDSEYFCDAIVDCRDGSDESDCFDFDCGIDGGTVDYYSRCDGFQDCANYSDEEDCEREPIYASPSGCFEGSTDPACAGGTNNGGPTCFEGSTDPACTDGEAEGGATGSSCSFSDQCAQGECLLLSWEEPQRIYTGGYCSGSCLLDADCPSESHCAAGGFCVAACADRSQCRTDGYDCYDHDNDGRTECHVGTTGPGDLGDFCESHRDCGGGGYGMCVSGNAETGYCTLRCGEGEADCPFNSHCVEGTELQFCLVSCEVPEDCATGTCQEFQGYLVCVP